MILKPNGEDTLILSNRADDKFSQKVRNLKSHKSLEKDNWVNFKEDKYPLSAYKIFLQSPILNKLKTQKSIYINKMMTL